MAVAVSAEQQASTFVRSPHKLLIDGNRVDAASGRTFTTLNPATEETLAEVAHGQAQDVERAVRAARKAFDDDSSWRRMNASDRGRLIWRISEFIEENADELAMLESLDNGKPYSVARAADIPLAASRWRPTCSATWRAGRRRSRAARRRSRRCRRRASTSPTRCASRSAWWVRSSRGTSRC
jgi:phenylacetaldehyde dehydrogenase